MSDNTEHLAATQLPDVGTLHIGELYSALKAGWFDFRTAPEFGIFFSVVYVLSGFLLLWIGVDLIVWSLVISFGFPLIAPFAAVGLYEVSRRIEAGEPLSWVQILSVIFRQKDRQIPWLGALILMLFLFWTFIAHMTFALFMGPSALTNISTSWESILTTRGYWMIGVEFVIGGVFAFVLFCISVISLPLLLEHEVDFVTAMLFSFKTVLQNPVTMLVWACMISLILFLAMLPMFLGLFVALPVLGHATWHLYRRAVFQEHI